MKTLTISEQELNTAFEIMAAVFRAKEPPADGVLSATPTEYASAIVPRLWVMLQALDELKNLSEAGKNPAPESQPS